MDIVTLEYLSIFPNCASNITSIISFSVIAATSGANFFNLFAMFLPTTSNSSSCSLTNFLLTLSRMSSAAILVFFDLDFEVVTFLARKDAG